MLVLECPVKKNDWVRRNGISPDGENRQAGKGVEKAGPWEPAVNKIIEFHDLDDDWDGLGATRPSREILESAIGLAYLLHEQGVPPPQCVVPEVDGTVTFEWHDPNGTYTEIEIDQPFHAEVMVLEPGKPPRYLTLPTE